MWRRNLTILVTCLCITALHGYSAGRSNPNYHYEPPAGARLELPINQNLATNSQQQQPQQGYQRQYKSFNQQQQQPIQQQTVALTSQGYNTKTAAIDAEPNSDSVRLPLPLGVASINIAPLPLMDAPSYTQPHGLTSYGIPAPYPGKRV